MDGFASEMNFVLLSSFQYAVFPYFQEYTCPRCDSGFIEELLDERRCVDLKHMSLLNYFICEFYCLLIIANTYIGYQATIVAV